MSHRRINVINLLTSLLLLASPARAEEATLNFETQGLDLDAGEVAEDESKFGVFMDHPEADIRIGYHADWPVKAVVFHNVNRGVELALLANTPFDDVTAENLSAIVLGSEIVDAPFNPGDTLVVRTDVGAHFKIGNAVENGRGVSFAYRRLDNDTATLHLGETTKTKASGGSPRLAALAWGATRDALVPRESDAQSRGIILSTLVGIVLLVLAVVAMMRWLAASISAWGNLAPSALVVIAISASSLGIVRAQGLNEQQKLTASDAASLDFFGFSVSLSGETALVGSPSPAFVTQGSAYVFVRDDLDVWLEQQKLTVPELDPLDRFDGFGESVSLYGDTALVSATGDDDHGGNSGAVYVFSRSGSTWTQQQKLTASDAEEVREFGKSVHVHGDTAVVGARSADVTGAVYVFVRVGDIWTQQQKLTASDAAFDDRFGSAVSLDRDCVLVGAPSQLDAGAARTGAVYVFERNGTSWTQQQKLTADDAAWGDNFGVSVSLDGDTALVGAHADDDLGSAYLFGRSAGTWTQQQKLTADDAATFDLFGESVALDGDIALVGARLDDDGGSSSGSTYVYIRTEAGWTQQPKLLAADAAAGDNFGISVSLHGHTALVGALGVDDGGLSNSGAVYVFALTPEELVEALAESVINLNLQEGIENGLDSKLGAVEQALADLNDNNNEAAIAALHAFINAVEAQRGKKISDADADRLIAAAEAIIAQLSA